MRFFNYVLLAGLGLVLTACGGGSSSNSTGDNQGPGAGYQLLANAQGLNGQITLGVVLKASSAADAAIVRELSLDISDDSTQILLDKIQLSQVASVSLLSKPDNQLCEISPALEFEFSQAQNQQVTVICQSIIDARVSFSKPAAYDFNDLSLSGVFEQQSQLQSASVDMQLTPNSLVFLQTQANAQQAKRMIYASVVGQQQAVLLDEFSTAMSLLLQDAAIAKALNERQVSLAEVQAFVRGIREQLVDIKALYQAIATAANEDDFDLLQSQQRFGEYYYPALQELAQLIVAQYPAAVYEPSIVGEVIYQDASMVFSQLVKANTSEFYLYNLGERYLALETDSDSPIWADLPALIAPSSEQSFTIANQDLVNQVVNFKATAMGSALQQNPLEPINAKQDIAHYLMRDMVNLPLVQFLSQQTLSNGACLGESYIDNQVSNLEGEFYALDQAARYLHIYKYLNAKQLSENQNLAFSLNQNSSSANFVLAEFKTTNAAKLLYCQQLGLAAYLNEIDAEKQVKAISYFSNVLSLNTLAQQSIAEHIANLSSTDVASFTGLLFDPVSKLTRFGDAVLNLIPASSWQYNQSYSLNLTLAQDTMVLGDSLTATASCLDNNDQAIACELNWNLGDNNEVQGQQLQYEYQQAGNYQLVLSASVNGVEIATQSRNIKVEAPDASFSLQSLDGVPVSNLSLSANSDQVLDIKLRLSNTGNQAYDIDFAMAQTQGFSLLGTDEQPLSASVSLNVGVSLEFIVRFVNSNIGDYSQTLSIANTITTELYELAVSVQEPVVGGDFGYWQQQQTQYDINRVEPALDFVPDGFAVIKAYSSDSSLPALFFKIYGYAGIGSYSLDDRGSESALGLIIYGNNISDNYRTVGSSSPLFSNAPATGEVTISEAGDDVNYLLKFNFEVYPQDCVSSILCQLEQVSGELKMPKPQ